MNSNDPFPFEYEEFEREIMLIGALHIYSTQVKAFDEEFLTKFVADYAA